MFAASKQPASQIGSEDPKPEHNRLILCFDGTGNQFSGTPADTNIVKLYNMFDRGDGHQMHYYQPGIGTYPAEGPVNVSFFRSLFRKIEGVIDQALATSFDSHVIAGYRFIMRYYRPGDKIYVFGFSRGAFTARFLSRMISHIGLLSMGNEELVPFAYKVYQDYEQNLTPDHEEKVKFMNKFKKHFCRTLDKSVNSKMSKNESGIKVHFLGLFDCVSSVGNLDVPFFKQAPPLPAVKGTAFHIRHAVAIDERRVKFKAALFSQEKNPEDGEDIKEVWFPGNHGDVGGGWPIDSKPKDTKESKGNQGIESKKTNQNKKQAPNGTTAQEIANDDPFQLSDIALKWMVDEIDDVDSKDDSAEPLKWDKEEKPSFLKRFAAHKDEMIKARAHDTMKRNGGSSNQFLIFLWNFMEYIPFVIKRWEFVKPREPRFWDSLFFWKAKKVYSKNTWVWDYIGFPTNAGGRRDIPSTALFHQSVISRMDLPAETLEPWSKETYVPTNPLWVVSNNPQCKEQNMAGDKIEQTRLNVLAPSAKSTGLTNGHRHSATERLLKFHFKHTEERTTGSVPIENHNIVVGPRDWDRIYSVEMASN